MFLKIFYNKVLALGRLYCKYAATNNPAIVTGIIPKTIPKRKGSIIYVIQKIII